MRGLWFVFLAGCGFHSSGPGGDGSGGAMGDAATGAMGSCWTIATTDPQKFNASACPTAVADSLEISTSTSIDTDQGTSNPAGLGCAPLAGNPAPAFCVLAAKAITVDANVTVSAHGSKPLVLLGHAITINGTIDVASHRLGAPQAQGPAADLAGTGCNLAGAGMDNGGGGGGGYDAMGGQGGDSAGSTGGKQGGSIVVDSLSGGCSGGAGSVGGGAIGGHGGGAVWISVDSVGTSMLVIGGTATINASGAGGAGGLAMPNHRGGYGGGSGGLIVLQAPAIMLDGTAKIFANGGGGGAGDLDTTAGDPGNDPSGPQPAAAGGTGAVGSGGWTPPRAGSGGAGFPTTGTMLDGTNGNDIMSGGGGGGGGPGAIRVVSNTDLTGTNPNMSPPLVQLH
jgi:hypothetical protein